MKDKAHAGSIDHTRDHHMINGQLVPVVETRSRPTAKNLKTDRRQTGRARKGDVAASETKAAASRST